MCITSIHVAVSLKMEVGVCLVYFKKKTRAKSGYSVWCKAIVSGPLVSSLTLLITLPRVNCGVCYIVCPRIQQSLI
jgi:hypothetical protein